MSVDDNNIISGSSNAKMLIHDRRTGEKIQTFEDIHQGIIMLESPAKVFIR